MQHEAGRAAYEDAQKQINEINARIETKTSTVKDIENKLVKLKLEASEARKLEQVSYYHNGFALMFSCFFSDKILGADWEISDMP